MSDVARSTPLVTWASRGCLLLMRSYTPGLRDSSLSSSTLHSGMILSDELSSGSASDSTAAYPGRLVTPGNPMGITP